MKSAKGGSFRLVSVSESKQVMKEVARYGVERRRA